MAVVTRFVVNQRGMDQVLKARNGPVVLHQANLGRKIAANARRLAPRGHGDGPHLADNIDSKLVPRAGGGFDVQIVAGVPHALYVAKGTKGHRIPKAGNKLLVFDWPGGPDGPGEYHFMHVNHPGTKPNRFMLRAAEMEGLRTRRLV